MTMVRWSTKAGAGAIAVGMMLITTTVLAARLGSAARPGAPRRARPARPLGAAVRPPPVLAGHDHDYQRSLPQDGVTYVVSGAAAKLRPTGSQPFNAVSASTRHFVDLLVHPDRLELRAVDQQGRPVDAVTLTR